MVAIEDRKKVRWSVGVAAAVTVVSAALFTVNSAFVGSALLWFLWLALSFSSPWLYERYKRTRDRRVLVLTIVWFLVGQGSVLLLGAVRMLHPTAAVRETFTALPVGIAWAVVTLIAFRPAITGPGAPPALRWRDLTAPRPER